MNDSKFGDLENRVEDALSRACDELGDCVFNGSCNDCPLACENTVMAARGFVTMLAFERMEDA